MLPALALQMVDEQTTFEAAVVAYLFALPSGRVRQLVAEGMTLTRIY